MMNSDTKTDVPSLIVNSRSDLFTIENIAEIVQMTNQSDSDRGSSRWEYAISYLPLKFYKLIEQYRPNDDSMSVGNGIVLTEEFDKKYIHNPKMYAYDKYGTTNMWRGIMILNRCASIMDFDFKYIRYYDPASFSQIMSVLISRMT